MNSFTNTLLTIMLGWVRTLLNAISGLLTSDSSTAFLDFFRINWHVIFIVLCIFGFMLDKIIYIIRWRPKPVWLRLGKKHNSVRPNRDPYTPPLYDDGGTGIAPNTYIPEAYEAPYTDPFAADAPYADETQTRQYQIQPAQYRQQSADTQVYQPYATPQYAPQAMQDATADAGMPPRWDDSAQAQFFPPMQDERQRFAFGMEPSFGSAQNEPAYHYHADTVQTFAPPQQAQATLPPEPFAPPAYAVMPEDPFSGMAPADGQDQNPLFRPFSDRGVEPYDAVKPRGLGTVAKKARNLFNPENAYESMTYQDLQPTVDVSKAFHAPVYPEKKPEGDA